MTYCVRALMGWRVRENEISIACPCRKTMCIGTVDPMLCLQHMDVDVERVIRSGWRLVCVEFVYFVCRASTVYSVRTVHRTMYTIHVHTYYVQV